MFDHLGFNVSDLAKSKAFYLAATGPLDFGLMAEGEGWAMIGNADARLWIGMFGTPATPIHLAIKAKSRAEVHLFHEAALRAGGRDNGAPGLRPQYAATYYAAFALDPDGHNIEAVTHAAT